MPRIWRFSTSGGCRAPGNFLGRRAGETRPYDAIPPAMAVPSFPGHLGARWPFLPSPGIRGCSRWPFAPSPDIHRAVAVRRVTSWEDGRGLRQRAGETRPYDAIPPAMAVPSFPGHPGGARDGRSCFHRASGGGTRWPFMPSPGIWGRDGRSLFPRASGGALAQLAKGPRSWGKRGLLVGRWIV